MIARGSPNLYLSNNLPVHTNDDQMSNTGSCKSVVLLVTNKSSLPNVIFYLHGLLCIVKQQTKGIRYLEKVYNPIMYRHVKQQTKGIRYLENVYNPIMYR